MQVNKLPFPAVCAPLVSCSKKLAPSGHSLLAANVQFTQFKKAAMVGHKQLIFSAGEQAMETGEKA